MRLIDADDLLTAFPTGDEPTVTIACIRATIKHMPTIEPEVIRCKYCRHRIVNDHYGEKGYHNNNIKAFCELDTGDPFELGRNAQNDDWFCGDAERRDD